LSEANRFIKMFLDKRIKFQWVKHLTEKITTVTSLIHVRVCGRPHSPPSCEGQQN